MRLSDAQLLRLELKGIHLIDSTRFGGVQYFVDGTGVQGIFGRCGKVQVNWDRLDELVAELYELKEVYDPKEWSNLTQDKPA